MSTSKRPSKTAKSRESNRSGAIEQLGNQPHQTSSRRGSSLAMQDLQKLAMGTRSIDHAINFGKPSSFSSAGTPKSTGSDWTGLVQKTITSGASQILGGGLLGSGFSSAFSALFHLFGGGTQVHTPALDRFSLPAIEQRTIDVARKIPGSQPTVGDSSQLMTQSSIQAENVSGGIQQALIVKTVRNALLTSSSLNDIIGEL